MANPWEDQTELMVQASQQSKKMSPQPHAQASGGFSVPLQTARAIPISVLRVRGSGQMEEIGHTELTRELSSNSRFPKEERSRKWLTRLNPLPSHCQVQFCQFMVKRAFSPNLTQCSRPSSSPTCPTDLWWRWPVIAETPGYLSLIHRLA